MKVKLNCVYETEKKTHQPGDEPDLPKNEAARLLGLGYASEIAKQMPAQKEAQRGGDGDGSGDAGNAGDGENG